MSTGPKISLLFRIFNFAWFKELVFFGNLVYSYDDADGYDTGHVPDCFFDPTSWMNLSNIKRGI